MKKLAWASVFCALLLSCVFIGKDEGGGGALIGASKESAEEERAEEPERDSPLAKNRQRDSFEREKHLRCQEMGDKDCQGDSRCENFCAGIFGKSSERRKCHALPYELVDKFDTLLEMVRSGEWRASSINPHVLECMLIISNKPFASIARRLKREDTEELLEGAASLKDLSAALRFGDKDGLILRALFDNLNFSEDSLLQLAAPVAGRVNFFEIALEENNRDAWEWIDDEAEEACERGSDACKYNTEEDGNGRDLFAVEAFYCRMFRGLKKKGADRLRSVVQSKIFAKVFAREMESHKVCGPEESSRCDARYTDHFESFCKKVYHIGEDGCLEDSGGGCL